MSNQMKVARPLAAALLMVSVLASGTSVAGDVFYTGRATAIKGTLSGGDTNQSVLVSDNGMSCQGRPKEETLHSIGVPGTIAISAHEAYTFTQGLNRRAFAESRISGMSFQTPGLSITSSLIDAQAEASCDESNAITVRGDSNVGSLEINGEKYEATGQPGQRINIGDLATIVLNEQTQYSREFSVIAMRVILRDGSEPLGANVRFAAARAKITCNP